MNSKLLWTLAVVGTLVSVVYQRTTGPTYPKSVSGDLGGIEIKAKFLRSHSVSGDLPVSITVADTAVRGSVTWRRYMSNDDWTTVALERQGPELIAHLPAQPSAGKLEYSVTLNRADEHLLLPVDEAVVARFKGDVPPYILIPHIFFMFFAMLWSIRTVLEALFAGPKRHIMSVTTLVMLMLGGLILGPIVQKYAFGAYWTGWPLGGDLTDNKLAVAVLAWLWAALSRGNTKRARMAVVIAGLVMMAVYMIPHSMRGSTLDYETMETISH